MSSCKFRTVLLALQAQFVATAALDARTFASKGSFWQVTDLHWDRLYSRTGDPFDRCHGLNITVDNGAYGNMQCDTSTFLYRSSVGAMAAIEPEVDFILWTGDNAPHIDYPNQTWSDVYNALTNASALLRLHFPTTDIFPVLGNHDTSPANQFPANDTQFYENYLTMASWDDFIGDNDTRETFLRGGYYSKVSSAGGQRILVLNTCMYLKSNLLVKETDVDPSGQFAWILEQLELARSRGESVIITSHVAVGYFSTGVATASLNMKPAFNDRLVQLMANQSDVLVALVFGHEHTDTFRLISSDQSDGDFKVAAFLAPPVNPWVPDFLIGKNAVNPAIRLYTYNASRKVIDDYLQFYMDYNEANVNASIGVRCDRSTASNDVIPSRVCICSEAEPGICAEWRLLYRPTALYNLTDLSLTSMVELYHKLECSSHLFDAFFSNVHADYVLGPCDNQCRQAIFCSFVNITEQAMESCFASANTLKRETYFNLN